VLLKQQQSMNNNKVAPIKLPLDNLINIDPNYISGSFSK
jgi:hypothetical protein